MRIGFYIGVNMCNVALIGSRLYLAFDASAVMVADVAEGVTRPSLRALVREPLAAGALVPGAAGPNLRDEGAVRDAIARALHAVGRGRVTLVLPDGTARLALVEPPPGVPAREYVRFRMASSLPWGEVEASVDTLDAGRGRAVGVVVRRATVAEYEHAAAAAGAALEQVNLAPLVALAGLRRARREDAVHALLGDAAMCLALVKDGALVALRSRRRDRSGDEARRLYDELRRLAARATNGDGRLPLVLTGADAPGLRRQLAAAVADAGLAPAPPAALGVEAAWLAALLA
jgi:hypothetical protein